MIAVLFSEFTNRNSSGGEYRVRQKGGLDRAPIGSRS